MDADDEQIRQRAYALWEQEGSPHGRHEQHWAAAQRQLREERAGTPPSEAGTVAPARKAATPRPRKRVAAKPPLSGKPNDITGA